jgi:hypothetical protein
VDILPGAHANVLIYLLSFLRQVFQWPVFLQNPEGKRRIGIMWVYRAKDSAGIRKSTDSELKGNSGLGSNKERDAH